MDSSVEKAVFNSCFVVLFSHHMQAVAGRALENFKSHMRVVFAFIVREMATRYGRSPGGYLWAILEPVAYVGMMSVLFGALARAPALGTSFPLFFATGYIAYSMYNGMAGYLSSSVSANKNLLQYPLVAPIDPFVGRAILQGLTSIVVATVILRVAWLTEPHPPAIGWAALIEATGFAWILASGIALTNIVLFQHFKIYEKIFAIVTRPLFLLSGVFYVPEQMPHPLREVLLWNPITQCIVLFREGFYGPTTTDGLDMNYLFWCVLGTAFVGMLTFTMWPIGRIRD
ncbi:capsular polysaccharide transport system permease protein [Rhizobium sp. NFR07]|uniref:ABC transporter permease n=1 Tax=Rhizobium sp. NFR07 TaxID=1566262 RepID=UPI0008E33906|nr:ABC transporter permease [Rhizobium sp. NFR07]SFB59583.1 capsular polysaccharide transport system permease protein [Rhizobium sp. NFR07]